MKFDLRIAVISLLSMFTIVSCGGGGGGGGGGGTAGPVQATACTDAAVPSLQVVSTTPANGASNVSVRTNISARFNTCVDMGKVGPTTFMVSRGGTPIPGTYVLDGANYTVVFTPSQNLNYNDSYVVLITTGVTGSQGESFTGAGWGFFTRVSPDTAAPTTTLSVAAGYYNTPQTVALSCNDGATGVGCAATYYTTNGSAPTTSSARYTGPISITSSTTLKFYSVDVDGNAESVQTADYVIDTVAPTVTTTFPANLAANVVLTDNVRATFSEPILQSTLTNASFYLDNGVAASISYDATTRTATLTPLERLACNTPHTATLTTGISDLAANRLAGNVTWSFTTHGDCAEPVTSASLAAGVYTSAQSVTLSCSDAGGSGCARIVYTTDGSVPSLANGTVVSAAAAGPISIPVGDTLLRYYAEDHAGNREVERRRQYSVSGNGFTYVATSGGISRGVGPAPTGFVNVPAPGRTLGFSTDASNGRFYRAAERGVYFSDDGGASWEHTLLTQGGMYAVVSDVYALGSKVYAATHNGLYVSTDGGASYVKRALTGGSYPTYEWVHKVRAQGNMVYVATSDGLLVSADKGHTYTPRTTANGLGAGAVYGLHVSGSTIYAATAGGLSISTDGGQTFVNKTTTDGLASNVVNAVAVSGTTVYAGTSVGLSISTNAGASFTATRTTANGLYANAVSDIHPGAAGALYLATATRVSISTDGGTTFVARQPAPWATGGVDVGRVYEQAGTLYAAAYPSFYQSADSGVSWKQQGLPTSFVKKVAVATNGTLYFYIEDSSGFSSIAVSTDKGKSYTIRNAGEIYGSSTYVNGMSVDGNTLYLAATGVAASGDGGNTFTVRTKTGNGLSEFFVNAVHAQGTTVYAVSSSGFLDKSTNGGANFTYQSIFGLGGAALAVSGSNVYLAGSSGLDVSNNGWATFVRRTTVDGLPSNYVSDVAVNALGQVFVITLNNGLATSTNNGQTFAPVGTAPATAYNVSTCGGALYVGTYSNGLYVSQDNAATFVQRNAATHGLISDSVTDACYVP